MHGRAKLFEFFSLAAELLEFDAALLEEVLTEPWNLEAEMMNSGSLGEADELPGQASPSQLDGGDSLYSAGVAAGVQFSKTFRDVNLNDEAPFHRRPNSIAIRETLDD